DRWLRELETRFSTHNRGSKPEPSRWDDLRQGHEDLARSLRRQLLRSARVETDRVRAYLASFANRADLLDRVFDELMTLAPVIAETHPGALADLTLLHLQQELPEDRMVRERKEEEAVLQRVAEARAKPVAERTREDDLALSGAFTRLGAYSISDSDWESLAID